MIIKNTATEYKEVTLDKDHMKIVRGERIPDGLLKANKIARDTFGLKYVDKEKEWHWVARVPKIVIDKLYREYPDEMKSEGSKFLYEWLDRPENNIWKTFEGKLI